MKDYIFISYSHKDKDDVKKIVKYLEDRNLRCWVDRSSKKDRDAFKKIANGLASSRVFLLVLSENSQKSEVALDELAMAKNKKLPLLSIQIDNCNLADDVELLLARAEKLKYKNSFKPLYDYLIDYFPEVKEKIDEENDNLPFFFPRKEVVFNPSSLLNSCTDLKVKENQENAEKLLLNAIQNYKHISEENNLDYQFFLFQIYKSLGTLFYKTKHYDSWEILDEASVSIWTEVTNYDKNYKDEYLNLLMQECLRELPPNQNNELYNQIIMFANKNANKLLKINPEKYFYCSINTAIQIAATEIKSLDNNEIKNKEIVCKSIPKYYSSLNSNEQWMYYYIIQTYNLKKQEIKKIKNKIFNKTKKQKPNKKLPFYNEAIIAYYYYKIENICDSNQISKNISKINPDFIKQQQKTALYALNQCNKILHDLKHHINTCKHCSIPGFLIGKILKSCYQYAQLVTIKSKKFDLDIETFNLLFDSAKKVFKQTVKLIDQLIDLVETAEDESMYLPIMIYSSINMSKEADVPLNNDKLILLKKAQKIVNAKKDYESLCIKFILKQCEIELNFDNPNISKIINKISKLLAYLKNIVNHKESEDETNITLLFQFNQDLFKLITLFNDSKTKSKKQNDYFLRNIKDYLAESLKLFSRLSNCTSDLTYFIWFAYLSITLAWVKTLYPKISDIADENVATSLTDTITDILKIFPYYFKTLSEESEIKKSALFLPLLQITLYTKNLKNKKLQDLLEKKIIPLFKHTKDYDKLIKKYINKE